MLGKLRRELEGHGFTGLAGELLKAINDARNAVHHYDKKANVDETFSAAMLALAESFIDLAYAVPRRISVLSLLVNGGTVAEMDIADATRRSAELRRVYEHGGMEEMVRWLARKFPPDTSLDPLPGESASSPAATGTLGASD